jgi:signal transduction histidine kinase
MMRSSAVNLAVGYVLFSIAALVAFAAPLWYGWHVSIQEGRAEILQEDAQRQAAVFSRDGVRGLTGFIEQRVGLQIAGERILLFSDPQQHILAGNLGGWPRGVPQTSGTYTITLDLDGHPTRVMLVQTVLPGGYKLLVARDLSLYAPVETRFWFGLTAAVAILLGVGAVGTILIRRELLARIQGIRQTVSAIMQGDLSHRLQRRGSGDELDTLSQTINRMLEQIEQLVHGIRNVSNSITHDLRTPLTELRSRLEELLLTRPPTQEIYLEVEAAVADVDRVIRIFNALLRLAEIDTGMRRSGFVRVDLAAVAEDAVDFYLPAAEQRGIALSFHGNGPAPVAGDPLLLAQALGNLVDNALKYAPSNGSVKVEVLRHDDGSAELCVADDGPGISDEDKPKAAQRFFRGDLSRGTPGVGLGLSIVDAVARLHGGFLDLADNHPGLRARMVIEAGQGAAARPVGDPVAVAVRGQAPLFRPAAQQARIADATEQGDRSLKL